MTFSSLAILAMPFRHPYAEIHHAVGLQLERRPAAMIFLALISMFEGIHRYPNLAGEGGA
jgi:hypothetical protein